MLNKEGKEKRGNSSRKGDYNFLRAKEGKEKKDNRERKGKLNR